MFFGIRDPGWEKIRIRDKHPGSATLAIRPFWTGPVPYHFSFLEKFFTCLFKVYP
jgi:hypothetical protein